MLSNKFKVLTSKVINIEENSKRKIKKKKDFERRKIKEIDVGMKDSSKANL